MSQLWRHHDPEEKLAPPAWISGDVPAAVLHNRVWPLMNALCIASDDLDHGQSVVGAAVLRREESGRLGALR
jgi:hypothetical protein